MKKSFSAFELSGRKSSKMMSLLNSTRFSLISFYPDSDSDSDEFHSLAVNYLDCDADDESGYNDHNGGYYVRSRIKRLETEDKMRECIEVCTRGIRLIQ